MSTATVTVRLRPLRQGESEPVVAVFGGMSAHSRHLRFHGPRPRLTESMRRALTDVDGHRHLALVAEVCEGDTVTPVGIGRLVALEDGVAEVAFAVVDAWHGQGIGRRLLTALRHRAVDLGYDALLAYVMAENLAAVRLLQAVLPHATLRRSGMSYEIAAVLPRRQTMVPVTLAV